MKELELYIHVPFCKRKCAYCDFYSGAFGENAQRAYFSMLDREIRTNSTEQMKKEYLVTSVFFGGGTPSVPDAELISGILRTIRNGFTLREDAEISLEANPGTLTREKLLFYRASGANRLSIGLQSADDRLLQGIGRIHNYQDFLDSYRLAREVGFQNINVDLISALPDMQESDWERTLRTVAALSPEHISAYSLMIEEGTPFYERFGPEGAERDRLPKEDADREMYRRTAEILSEYGYHRYEISNYAKAGYECRHNIGYWTGTAYLGFGASAASYMNGKRYRNASSLSYLSLPHEEEEEITPALQKSEFMILGLRMIRGVSDTEYRKRFGESMFTDYPDVLRKYVSTGFLLQEGDRIFLSERGLDVSNVILSEFL